MQRNKCQSPDVSVAPTAFLRQLWRSQRQNLPDLHLYKGFCKSNAKTLLAALAFSLIKIVRTLGGKVGASFLNIVVLMFISVCAVALFKRVHLPPILAYLFAGVLAGPQLLSVFAHPEEMHLLAEVGIVFLLFSLGLEFSLPKLLAMRSLVFGVGLNSPI